MKVALAVLVVLGLVAAVAVAVLIGAVTMPARQTAAPAATEVDVLVAARSLAAMSTVDRQSVIVMKVSRAAVPMGALSDPVQAVGKVVILPVVAGEALTEAGLTQKGLAAVLPPGMRALSISLNDHAGMVGLLAPGCFVDVMMIRGPDQARSTGAENEPAGMMTLRGVQVLAVGQEMVTADLTLGSGKKLPGLAPTAPRGDQRMVTLLVSTAEARLLVNAQQGTISLALRNPMDRDPAESRLTTEGVNVLNPMGPILKGALSALRESWAGRPRAPGPSTLPAHGMAQQPKPEPPSWVLTIIRGGSSEKQTFPMPWKDEGSEQWKPPLGVEAQNGNGRPE